MKIIKLNYIKILCFVFILICSGLGGAVSARGFAADPGTEISATYYVLNRDKSGYRSNPDPQFYTHVGYGTVIQPDGSITDDPTSVQAALASLPGLSGKITLAPNEEIRWYRINYASNNKRWWVYGEIVEKAGDLEPPTDETPDPGSDIDPQDPSPGTTEKEVYATFLVLKPEAPGYAKSSNDPQFYSSLGGGYIQEPVEKTVIDLDAISDVITKMPNLSSLALSPGQEVVWYRVAYASNNNRWWIYGEIVEGAVEPETPITETPDPENPLYNATDQDVYATFLVLKPEAGYAKDNNDPQFYSSLGGGYIQEPVEKTIMDINAIASGISKTPDLSSLGLSSSQEVVWYRVTYASNNNRWWVYGEILEIVDPGKPLPVNDATELVKAMKVGWNLGNSLESLDVKKYGILTPASGITPEVYYETLWKNPLTTNAMIKTVADAGFGAVRIPVTYSDHMDENFVIRKEWLTRVEQVVNYVLDNNMYCIINIHHDTGSGSWPWLTANPGTLEQDKQRLQLVWEQISGYFKDYDDRLLFEGFNEILDTKSQWNNASAAVYDAVNQLNQTFVDTVRNSGGKNASRFLILNTYAAGADSAILNAFILPQDTVADRLIVSAHTYAPAAFCWDTNLYGGSARSQWLESSDGQDVESVMRRLYSFTSKGIPVIIGEFAAYNKNNTADRAAYASHFVGTARDLGITCFWWDGGGTAATAADARDGALLNRNANRWYFPEIVEALVSAASEA